MLEDKTIQLSPLVNEIYCNAKIFHWSIFQHGAGVYWQVSIDISWHLLTLYCFHTQMDADSPTVNSVVAGGDANGASQTLCCFMVLAPLEPRFVGKDAEKTTKNPMARVIWKVSCGHFQIKSYLFIFCLWLAIEWLSYVLEKVEQNSRRTQTRAVWIGFAKEMHERDQFVEQTS